MVEPCRERGVEVWDERNRHTGISEKQHRNRGLFKREQKTDFRVKGGEDDIPWTNRGVVVDFGENSINKRIEFDSIGIHFLLFGFVEHWVFYDTTGQFKLEYTDTMSTYSSRC